MILQYSGDDFIKCFTFSIFQHWLLFLAPWLYMCVFHLIISRVPEIARTQEWFSHISIGFCRLAALMLTLTDCLFSISAFRSRESLCLTLPCCWAFPTWNRFHLLLQFCSQALSVMRCFSARIVLRRVSSALCWKVPTLYAWVKLYLLFFHS